MLSVSKEWKEILTQCQPWVRIQIILPGKIADVAHWLEIYACIVQYLQVFDLGMSGGENVKAADQLLGSSLQLAAFNRKPAGLQSVDLYNLLGRKLLSSLPAASLTELKLGGLNPADPCISHLAPGIGKLTNLQSCSLWFDNARTIPSHCLSSLSALTRLSSLTLGTKGRSLNPLPHLPPQLQSLSIDMGGELVLAASSLTQLTSFSLTAREGIAEGSQLPPSLTSLTLTDTPLHASTAHMLSNVRILSVEAKIQLSDAALAGLRRLAQLDSISMDLKNARAAAAASAAWQQLPQLRELRIVLNIDGDEDEEDYQPAEPEEAEQLGRVVIEALAAATQLTSLSLILDENNNQCGSALAHLKNLQELTLAWGSDVREDMLQLRALTQLKVLRLSSCAMDNTAAVALLCRLTGLQHLKLSGCENVTDAVVPVIGAQLRGLRSLDLFMLHGFSDDSVQSLVELTQLKSLSLWGLGLTSEGVLQLKAAAPFSITVLDV
jgi:hypothetical protein